MDQLLNVLLFLGVLGALYFAFRPKTQVVRDGNVHLYCGCGHELAHDNIERTTKSRLTFQCSCCDSRSTFLMSTPVPIPIKTIP